MILAYHEVLPVENTAYSVSCGRMEEHLRLVASTNQRNASHALAVTFDDGEESQFRHGLPLLEKHGVKACFFVNVGFLGQTRTIKGWVQRFMDWPELQELVRLGHSVQSHGWSHEFLTACSPEELDNQLRRSKQTLEDRLGSAVDSISAPGGRWNSRVLERCAQVGYKNLFMSDPWISSRVCEGIMLHGRYMVLRSSTPETLAALLEIGGLKLLSLRLRGELKHAARTVLGEQMYHSLWKRFMREGSDPDMST